jgi:hypothetical protein
MEVSPAVFSEIQEKAAEGAVRKIAFPYEFDSFALWAHETFGCVYYTEYKVVVVWEWGTLRKWAFPQG